MQPTCHIFDVSDPVLLQPVDRKGFEPWTGPAQSHQEALGLTQQDAPDLAGLIRGKRTLEVEVAALNVETPRVVAIPVQAIPCVACNIKQPPIM